MTKVPGGQREANKDHQGGPCNNLAIALPQPPAGMTVLLQLCLQKGHSIR